MILTLSIFEILGYTACCTFRAEGKKEHPRIGRVKEKYPSVGQYYNYSITVTQDEPTHLAAEITWQKDETKYDEKINTPGIYFLRPNLPVQHEVEVWNIYNTS